MSTAVIELILSEIGATESVRNADKCAFAYLSKFTENQHDDSATIAYLDFSVVRNEDKLQLYGKKFDGTNELISPQLIHQYNLVEADSLCKTMVDAVHNHYLKNDSITVDLVRAFLATSPDALSEREFMDLWAQFYKSERKSPCSRCAVINGAMYNIHGC
jgi:hypothetical protein